MTTTENNVAAQAGDFDPAPKYEYSLDGKTVKWTNRDRMPKVAAQAGDEPMRAARSIGTDRAFEAAAKALHLAWTPEGVHALIAAADAFIAAQVSPRATADVERLNWLVHHGAAMRIDPMTNQWYIETVHRTGISCVDDRIRFDTANAAIDAAIATTKPGA